MEVTKPRWTTKAEEAAATTESKTSAALLELYPFRDTTVDGLLVMLGLGDFQGRHHSGLDDTKNIANIFVRVAGKVAEIAQEEDDNDDEDNHSPVNNGNLIDKENGVAKAKRISAASVQKAMALEKSVLHPNTSTEKAHMRRWDWMSSVPGQVVWNDLPEV